MKQYQIKNDFCPVTLKKVLKGALYSASGAFAIAFLSYFQTVEISNPQLASLVAFSVPFLINVIKEYASGEKDV